MTVDLKSLLHLTCLVKLPTLFYEFLYEVDSLDWNLEGKILE